MRVCVLFSTSAIDREVAPSSDPSGHLLPGEEKKHAALPGKHLPTRATCLITDLGTGW
ncbi:hypothetical protein AGR7A_Cc160056 [Agrobacterium deltaense NCPPB 1641]|uniref:Uncharacterized protein n=1 Tax=Agrobacterium deltaense NCPPB 1641 TaxID=1183425 RepID=A0A1S7TKC8_9HYPH|nr:hypothetical protein AGR7A_Cc160056 [Agrobacterium deltaense NCPPB 1641]